MKQIEKLLQVSYQLANANLHEILNNIIPKKDVVVIGIEGPSGSGKTTLSKQITKEFTSKKAALIPLDDYIRYTPNEMKKNEISTRYDWRSRDRQKLLEDIEDLRNGKVITKPMQNFVSESPWDKEQIVEPQPYIIVEGNLDVSDIADVVIFLFASDAVLSERRFARDKGKNIHNDLGKLRLSIEQSLPLPANKPETNNSQ